MRIYLSLHPSLSLSLDAYIHTVGCDLQVGRHVEGGTQNLQSDSCPMSARNRYKVDGANVRCGGRAGAGVTSVLRSVNWSSLDMAGDVRACVRVCVCM